MEVIVCNKSSKERESPAKSRKARENAQRINNESNIQRDLNLVQSVPALLETEAARDIPLQLPNATMSQPIIIDKQIPIEIYQSDVSIIYFWELPRTATYSMKPCQPTHIFESLVKETLSALNE